mmetsp:Transcript_10657/g.17306  ORF Transcript_10657/g.17306 Transcript_10657/m.17306 type:complete len:248 (+) Transcript_10657:195-938(+)
MWERRQHTLSTNRRFDVQSLQNGPHIRLRVEDIPLDRVLLHVGKVVHPVVYEPVKHVRSGEVEVVPAISLPRPPDLSIWKQIAREISSGNVSPYAVYRVGLDSGDAAAKVGRGHHIPVCRAVVVGPDSDRHIVGCSKSRVVSPSIHIGDVESIRHHHRALVGNTSFTPLPRRVNVIEILSLDGDACAVEFPAEEVHVGLFAEGGHCCVPRSSKEFLVSPGVYEEVAGLGLLPTLPKKSADAIQPVTF